MIFQISTSNINLWSFLFVSYNYYRPLTENSLNLARIKAKSQTSIVEIKAIVDYFGVFSGIDGLLMCGLSIALFDKIDDSGQVAIPGMSQKLLHDRQLCQGQTRLTRVLGQHGLLAGLAKQRLGYIYGGRVVSAGHLGRLVRVGAHVEQRRGLLQIRRSAVRRRRRVLVAAECW